MRMLYDSKNIFTNKIFVMLVAVLCTALWGNMIPAIRLGFALFGILDCDSASQIFFAGICFTLSGLFTISIPCIKLKKIIFPSKGIIYDTLILGFVQTSLQYILLYIGLPYTSGLNASVISSSGTFFIIILAHFVYKNDKMNVYKVIGCVLGLLGVVMLNFNSLYPFRPTFTIKGEGMIFLSTLTFVLTSPLCKKLSQYADPYIFTGYSFIIGGVILIFIGLIYQASLRVDAYGILMLIYLALASAISGTLWNCLLKYNKVSEVTIYNFLVPIFGAVSSMFILNENIMDIKSLCALLLTCTGIYYTQRDEKTEKGI